MAVGGDAGVHPHRADGEVVEVGVSAHGLLNLRKLHLALGLVRAFAIGADAEESPWFKGAWCCDKQGRGDAGN